jgi:signal transduction histidine kinase
MTNRNRLRILWAVQLTVIIAVTYLIAFNYHNAIVIRKKMVLNKLKAIVCTATLQLDAEIHRRLTQQWTLKNDPAESSSDYQILHEQLNRIKQANNVASPLYTLIYDSSYHLFQFIVTTSEHPNFRHDYIHFPRILQEDFAKGGLLDVYESENGTWLSAFAPIKDKLGNAVAVLQADEEFSAFIAEAHKQLIRQSLLALLTVFPLVALLVYYTRKSLIQQEKYEGDLLKQQQAIIHQSQIIKNQNQKLTKKNEEVRLLNNKLDSKVRQRTKKLLETTQELKTYLYRSSHDMRSPITSLLGLSRLMITEGKIEPYAEMISQTTETMAQRMTSLAEVYEIKSRKIEPELINIQKLVDDISESLKGETNYLLCKDTESIESIFVDATLTKLVLKEAVYNAVYHNRNSGRKIKIWLKVSHHNEHLTLEVRDDGIGINERVREKVFEMFFRGNEFSQGMGLGLFKVKLIAERFKGVAFLESAPGKGARLCVQLPSKPMLTLTP